jgi:hypothetical protein
MIKFTVEALYPFRTHKIYKAYNMDMRKYSSIYTVLS